MTIDDNKRKALTSALGQIEKQFGKGAIMRMGDRVNEAIETVSTGSLGLDIALGVGGLPRGRVVEIYGPESSGKTTMTLQAIASCQRAGGTVEKPVGTVWISWKRRGGYGCAQLFHFPGDREAVRRQTVAAALAGLRKILTE